MLHMNRFRPLIGLMAATLLVGACSGAATTTPTATTAATTAPTATTAATTAPTATTATTSAPTATAEGAVVETAQYGAIEGPWLIWNPQTCMFEETSDHPSTYEAVLREVGPSVKMVFTPEATTFPVDVLFNHSVKEAADKAKITYLQLSNDYPSVERPLQVADQAVTAEASIVLSALILPDLYPQVEKKYKDACIPMLNGFAMKGPLDPHPKIQTPFKLDGINMAEASIKMIKERGWPSNEIWIVSCGEIAIAPGPGTNLDTVTAFNDRIKQEFNVPDSQISPILECPAVNGSEGSRVAMADWLTAHPQAKYVVGSNWNDVRGPGMAKALAEKGFTDNALICGRDASAAALEIIASGDPIFACDLDAGFLHWGQYLVSMGEDVLAGKPVPGFAAPATLVVTPENVQEVLAERAKIAQ